jgi:hypothetical protein
VHLINHLLLQLCVAAAIGVGAVKADAVFQHAVDVATTKKTTTAFLWVPPEARRIRGVLMAGMTLAERELVQDPQVRAVCATEQLAIVFVKAGLSAVDIQKTLDDLARSSGYAELSRVPLFFVGHSAGGPQAKAAATKFADRCFGVMQHRGGAPNWDPPLPAGVPALMMLGQFDEFGKSMMRDEAGRENWENGRDDLAKFRGADPGNLGSIVIEPGAGHFAWSDRNAAYFSLFLRKAAQARIPVASAHSTAPVRCKRVDPARGWLSDLTLKAPGQAPASYRQYPGDKTHTSWHFDRAMAEATVAYHKDLGKSDQFIRWTDPVTVEEGARFFFNQIAWIGDGSSFRVHPTYADSYPRTQPDGKGPRWSLAGRPVGHAATPIRVRAIGGPLVPSGEHTLEVRFSALAPATEPARGTFLAFNEGDAQFRYTEQVGLLRPGFVAPQSETTKLVFPSIGEIAAQMAPVLLAATSELAAPIRYYVAHGPATIVDGKLVLKEIPRRARWPLEVKVVAYQVVPGATPGVRAVITAEQTVRVRRR